MVERDIKFRSAGEFEGENFAGLLLPGQHLQSAKARDAVVEVHHQFVLDEIIEAQILPGQGRPGSLPAAAPLLQAGRAPEDFRVGEQHEPRFRQQKPAGDRPQNHGQWAGALRLAGRQLAQARGLAFIGAGDLHIPALGLPAADLAEQVAPSLFEQDDVAGRKVPGRMGSGGDLDFVAVGQDRPRVQADRRAGHGFLDREKERVGGQVIADFGLLAVVGGAVADLAGIEGLDRALRVGIAVKFQPDGKRGLPRKDIQDAAAHGVLAAHRGGGHAGESRTLQLRGQLARVE